jgi:hypothetical protein
MSENQERVVFDPDIHFWAFRYALGRMTYAVSDVAMALHAHKHRLPERVRETICREITEAEERGGLGHECDQRAWIAVREALSSQPQGKSA